MDKNFLVPSSTEPLPGDYERLSRDELLKQLQVYIAELLENNFEKLCNMIYRHDVLESKFNLALQEKTLEGQSLQIAHLVLEREMEKVKTRNAYRKQKEENMLDTAKFED